MVEYIMDRDIRPITTDAALRLLSDRQRRGVLHRLSDADSPVSVESLTASLATPTTEAGGVRLRLLHNHLPKLHDSNVIDYDRDGQTVRRGRDFDAVAPLLRAATHHREHGHSPDRSGGERSRYRE